MIDHVRRVLRRRFHRRHARALFGGGRLEQDAVELKLDVLRQQVVEDLLRARLVEVVDRRLLGVSSQRALDRQQPLDAHAAGR